MRALDTPLSNDKEAPGPEPLIIVEGPLTVPQPGSPQCIICRARRPLLRDLLLSCKLGLFTPNKAGDYLLEKQSIDGGGRRSQRRDVKGWGGGGGRYRDQALPCRLVIQQQQRPSDLLAGDNLGWERQRGEFRGQGRGSRG